MADTLYLVVELRREGDGGPCISRHTVPIPAPSIGERMEAEVCSVGFDHAWPVIWYERGRQYGLERFTVKATVSDLGPRDDGEG